MLTAALTVPNSQAMEATYTSINGWVDKENTVLIEYYLALEKEKIPAICSNMDECGGYCMKRNKPVKQRQILSDSTYMRYLQ